jgi:hypothetical protein
VYNALEQSKSRRGELRRAVRVEADVVSDCWDGSVPFVATNLSPDGLWLDSDLPLDVGEEVLVSLRPPHWGHEEPLTALAQVARVGLFRRRRERRVSGMGLRFVDMEQLHAELLQHVLRGLPPPLPKRSQRSPLLEVERPSIEEMAGLPPIVLADGTRFTLRAEGALLTAGRGPLVCYGPAETQRAYPRLARPLPSSPMSAILDRSSRSLRIVG